MPSWQDVYQYNIGQRLILHTHHGSQYPVEVIAHTALSCCMIIKDLANVTIDTRNRTDEDHRGD